MLRDLFLLSLILTISILTIIPTPALARSPSTSLDTQKMTESAVSNDKTSSKSRSPKPTFTFRPDPDFAAYMQDMQTRIKRHWFAPRDHSSHVRLTFKVDSVGNVSHIRIASGSPDKKSVDAAIESVKKASPLSPLPDGSPAVVDIDFGFDFNLWSDPDHCRTPEEKYNLIVSHANAIGSKKEIADAYILRAQFYSKDSSKYDFAISDYREAIKNLRSINYQNTEMFSELLVNLARLHLEQEEYSLAVPLFREALFVYRNHPDATAYRMVQMQRALADTLFNLGAKDSKEAEYLLREALALAQNFKDVELLVGIKQQLAHSLLLQKKFQGAIPLYEYALLHQYRGISSTFEMGTNCKELGDCLYNLGSEADAAHYYELAVDYLSSMAPEYVDYYSSMDPEYIDANEKLKILRARLNLPDAHMRVYNNQKFRATQMAFAWLPFAFWASVLGLLFAGIKSPRRSPVEISGINAS